MDLNILIYLSTMVTLANAGHDKRDEDDEDADRYPDDQTQATILFNIVTLRKLNVTFEKSEISKNISCFPDDAHHHYHHHHNEFLTFSKIRIHFQRLEQIN